MAVRDFARPDWDSIRSIEPAHPVAQGRAIKADALTVIATRPTRQVDLDHPRPLCPSPDVRFFGALELRDGAVTLDNRRSSLGRWHDMSSRSGVAILEFDDATAVQRFIGRWNSYMDIDLAPVLDDEETATVAKQILAEHEFSLRA